MTGVILGAFGAHALKESLAPESLNSFETGVRYQMFHGLALLVLSLYHAFFPSSLLRTGLWLFSIGTVFFSGSIYLLTTRSITGLTSTTILGPITPIGGTLLIIAWTCFIVALLKMKR